MLPIPSYSSRLACVVRFGSVLTLLALCFLAGCSRFGCYEKVSLDPTLEMGQVLPKGGADADRFAVSNEARHIENRLLDPKRTTTLSD